MSQAQGEGVYILGDGESGKAALDLLPPQTHPHVVSPVSLVVASPGVRVVSELQLGVEALAKRGVKMLAVTGSKGKSSVVKLLAEALGGVPCGNYGLPVSRVAKMEPPPEWAVVEVSSFQLETTCLQPDSFVAAAILNLQEDHISRHGSVKAYHAIKRRLLDFAPVAFDCEAGERGKGAEKLYEGSYFDNPILAPNARIAVAMLRVAGLDDERIRKAFLAFRPLPHRMEKVGVFGGVSYIDDSKATSIAALAAGVEMATPPILLIAGGLPKGDDPKSAIGALTDRVKKVYTIGQSSESFAEAWKSAVECEECGTLERAVEAAKRDARPGDTVLLSPGAASFDQFISFEERGQRFADLVKKGKDKR